ncbi:MAG: TIGR03560 family F420-dependent LLM class oxidoreductase [Deltaproteobacteria bacterium]|nr:TIGR03560 family F420-dependent LLM class oxidoreductase [Deltaproteobacteria bacterium]MBI3390216.1 TIGR03560 family F420-dependent LLM class oxidoreductase [Deltaproteobacteria bacterium]
MPAMKFGLFFPQVGIPFPLIRQRAQLADRLGYDSIFFVDHMWSRGLPDMDHLEAWTVMAATAAITERLKIGTLVLCNSYRNPALLAKMAASLDAVSNGRLIFGIGAGWMDEEYRAYGYPFPSVRTRIEQLDEGLEIITRMFREPRATFQGKYYAVADAANNPKPAQQPHPPILIGGAGEKRLLRVVARHADIWNCPNNVATELPHKLDVLREHCATIKRDPNEIEVSEQCVVVLGKDDADFKQKWEFATRALGRVFDLEKTAFRGTPQQVIDQLHKRREQGVTFFTMLFGDFHRPETLELFAEKVAPACR